MSPTTAGPQASAAPAAPTAAAAAAAGGRGASCELSELGPFATAILQYEAQVGLGAVVPPEAADVEVAHNEEVSVEQTAETEAVPKEAAAQAAGEGAEQLNAKISEMTAGSLKLQAEVAMLRKELAALSAARAEAQPPSTEEAAKARARSRSPCQAPAASTPQAPTRSRSPRRAALTSAVQAPSALEFPELQHCEPPAAAARLAGSRPSRSRSPRGAWLPGNVFCPPPEFRAQCAAKPKAAACNGDKILERFVEGVRGRGHATAAAPLATDKFWGARAASPAREADILERVVAEVRGRGTGALPAPGARGAKAEGLAAAAGRRRSSMGGA